MDEYARAGGGVVGHIGPETPHARMNFESSPLPCIAGCTFDSLGGDTWVIAIIDAPLIIANSTMSNIQQRNSIIEYDPTDEEFTFAGVISASGSSATATVLVPQPPCKLFGMYDRIHAHSTSCVQ